MATRNVWLAINVDLELDGDLESITAEQVAEAFRRRISGEASGEILINSGSTVTVFSGGDSVDIDMTSARTIGRKGIVI